MSEGKTRPRNREPASSMDSPSLPRHDDDDVAEYIGRKRTYSSLYGVNKKLIRSQQENEKVSIKHQCIHISMYLDVLKKS